MGLIFRTGEVTYFKKLKKLLNYSIIVYATWSLENNYAYY